MEDKLILNDIVKWWEKKRLWYNIIVGTTGIITIISISPSFFGLLDVIGIIIWGIGANIFFSLGLLIEIYNLYYLNGKFPLKSFRWIFFISGILFSCYLTLINILIYYNELIIG